MISHDLSLKRKRSVNLSAHHSVCEFNFHQLLRLLPGLRDGVQAWSFAAGREAPLLSVKITVLEKAPYTTTIAVDQGHSSVETPRMLVRLYHDVGMAEIVSWDHHRHWQAQYKYPNAKMYHPDEKLALNQFLGDWLNYCRNQGLESSKTVIQFS
jgi:uncharacterized protein YqiB (DUF1249 family)